MEVPVLQDTIYINDVESELGISLSKCLDSNAYCFQKETDTDGELYNLYYLKNIWLRSATVDGNYFDYFLDLNGSYKEIFRPFVETEILTNDVYEWIYSTQLINKFPALSNYRFNEVYGYFGLVVVPETYTLNSALAMMFNVETSKVGVISTFSFEQSLPFDAYNTLLTDYNYGFLSKPWSNVVGYYTGQERNATFYVIYSEPGTESALIGEGVQTDAENPVSVIEDKIYKPAGGVIANLWTGIIGFLKGVTAGTQSILWTALIIAVIIGGLWVYVKLFKGNNTSTKRRRRK